MAGVKLIGTIQGSKIESIDPARRIGTIQTLPTKRAKWHRTTTWVGISTSEMRNLSVGVDSSPTKFGWRRGIRDIQA